MAVSHFEFDVIPKPFALIHSIDQTAFDNHILFRSQVLYGTCVFC